MTCRRDRCTVYFELDEDFLKVLKRRQFVQLEIIDPPARGAPFPTRIPPRPSTRSPTPNSSGNFKPNWRAGPRRRAGSCSDRTEVQAVKANSRQDRVGGPVAVVKPAGKMAHP